MAQTNVPANGFNDTRRWRYSSNVAVSDPAAGNTTLLQVPVNGMERLFVQISVASFALDAFIISAKAHPDATAVTLFSAAGDYTSPAGLMIDASGDLTAVAASGTGWFMLDVRGMCEVTVQASATGGTAAVTIYAGGY